MELEPLNEGPLPPEPQLGESPEAYEQRRIAALPVDGAPVALKPLMPAQDVELRKAISIVVRQEFADVRHQLEQIRHDIASNTENLKLVDIPLEQVADSHERATHSFETLRAENFEIRTRLDKIEELLQRLVRK
jgi:hypothetical protein